MVQLPAVFHEALLPAERVSQRVVQEPHVQVGARGRCGGMVGEGGGVFACFCMGPHAVAACALLAAAAAAPAGRGCCCACCHLLHGSRSHAWCLRCGCCLCRKQVGCAPASAVLLAAAPTPLEHSSSRPYVTQAGFVPGERVVALLLSAEPKHLRLTTMELEQQVRGGWGVAGQP